VRRSYASIVHAHTRARARVYIFRARRTKRRARRMSRRRRRRRLPRALCTHAPHTFIYADDLYKRGHVSRIHLNQNKVTSPREISTAIYNNNNTFLGGRGRRSRGGGGGPRRRLTDGRADLPRVPPPTGRGRAIPVRPEMFVRFTTTTIRPGARVYCT